MNRTPLVPNGSAKEGRRNKRFDKNEFILCGLQTTILFSYLRYKCLRDNIDDFTLCEEGNDTPLLNKKKNKRNDGNNVKQFNSKRQ